MSMNVMIKYIVFFLLRYLNSVYKLTLFLCCEISDSHGTSVKMSFSSP
jgi:hypothetical protein